MRARDRIILPRNYPLPRLTLEGHISHDIKGYVCYPMGEEIPLLKRERNASLIHLGTVIVRRQIHEETKDGVKTRIWYMPIKLEKNDESRK